MTFIHETLKIAQYIFITNHLQLQVNLQCKLLIVHENVYGRNLTLLTLATLAGIACQ